MRTDGIAAIGIDENGSLWVKPSVERFPLVYREAVGVNWDPDRLCLYSPKPRDWSYSEWFQQIRAAAQEQGVELKVGPSTVWHAIDADLRQAIERLRT